MTDTRWSISMVPPCPAPSDLTRDGVKITTRTGKQCQLASVNNKPFPLGTAEHAMARHAEGWTRKPLLTSLTFVTFLFSYPRSSRFSFWWVVEFCTSSIICHPLLLSERAWPRWRQSDLESTWFFIFISCYTVKYLAGWPRLCLGSFAMQLLSSSFHVAVLSFRGLCKEGGSSYNHHTLRCSESYLSHSYHGCLLKWHSWWIYYWGCGAL